MRHLRSASSLVCLVVLIPLLLAGCASTYRDPRTQGLASHQFAILEEYHDLSSRVYVAKVNGGNRGIGSFTRYELLPGRNTLLVTGNSHSGMHPDPKELAFLAEAGRVYRLKYETSRSASLLKPGTWNDGSGRWHAWIIDKTTGLAVDEESIAKKEPNQSLQRTGPSARR